jgi:hypothetical protein
MKTKKTITKKMLHCLVMFLLLNGFSTLNAQMVTVTPEEYPDALTNPLMGFRRTLDRVGDKSYMYTSLVRQYIKWSEIENNSTDGVQKIIDFCDSKWAALPGSNVKVIPRVYIDWDSASGNEFWPADILSSTGMSATNPDLWKTEIVRNRIVKLIEKLGQAWNNDPRVAWVETGIVGYWGEQESPVGVAANVVAPDNSNYAKIMGDAFTAAFPNKKVLVRNHTIWNDQGHNKMGIYWDSFAHTQQPNAWANIKNANTETPARHLISPMEGEVAYDWGDAGRNNYAKKELDTKYYPTSTATYPQYYNFIINTIKQLHTSTLGWVSGYTPGPETAEGANQMQKAFGYRFKISEFKCSALTNPGSTLAMSAKIKNIGSTVYHENWPVAFILVDETTRQIVYQSVISGTDTRTWKPGSNYDWDPILNPNGSKVYLTPAIDNSISASIPIPSNITPGVYLAGLAILDPSTERPGVFFATNNFFKESQSQPLCRIGIGVNATNHIITGPFNNPVSDDARTYNYKHTITASAGTNGSITQSGSVSVINGESKSFTITPNSGYIVDAVSVNGVNLGAITSYTFNNVKLDHTISATFKPIVILSVDEKLLANSVKVYPNPVSNILNINSEGSSENVITVFNTLGQIVFKTKSNSQNTQINMQSLHIKGFVIVEVIADGTVSNHKVLIK